MTDGSIKLEPAKYDEFLTTLLASLYMPAMAKTAHVQVPKQTLQMILTDLIEARTVRSMDKQQTVDFLKVFIFENTVRQINDIIKVYMADVDGECEHLNFVANMIDDMLNALPKTAGSA